MGFPLCCCDDLTGELEVVRNIDNNILMDIDTDEQVPARKSVRVVTPRPSAQSRVEPSPKPTVSGEKGTPNPKTAPVVPAYTFKPVPGTFLDGPSATWKKPKQAADVGEELAVPISEAKAAPRKIPSKPKLASLIVKSESTESNKYNESRDMNKEELLQSKGKHCAILFKMGASYFMKETTEGFGSIDADSVIMLGISDEDVTIPKYKLKDGYKENVSTGTAKDNNGLKVAVSTFLSSCVRKNMAFVHIFNGPWSNINIIANTYKGDIMIGSAGAPLTNPKLIRAHVVDLDGEQEEQGDISKMRASPSQFNNMFKSATINVS